MSNSLHVDCLICNLYQVIYMKNDEAGKWLSNKDGTSGFVICTKSYTVTDGTSKMLPDHKCYIIM
jgi:hypothetical protein